MAMKLIIGEDIRKEVKIESANEKYLKDEEKHEEVYCYETYRKYNKLMRMIKTMKRGKWLKIINNYRYMYKKDFNTYGIPIKNVEMLLLRENQKIDTLDTDVPRIYTASSNTKYTIKTGKWQKALRKKEIINCKDKIHLLRTLKK